MKLNLKMLSKAVLPAIILSFSSATTAGAQSSNMFEQGVQNNEGWNFLNSARNFDAFFDGNVRCTNQANTKPSFQCVDAKLESALNFINAGKFEEGRVRIREARQLSRSPEDSDLRSTVGRPGLNYGSLYARSFQYEALHDLRLGESAKTIAANTARARRYRDDIRKGLRSFDGSVVSDDFTNSVESSGDDLVITEAVAERLSPKFDVSPAPRSQSDIATTYGRFKTTPGQQLAIQDAQSYLVESYALSREGQNAEAAKALSLAIESLNAPKAIGGDIDAPVSTARAPFLWAMIEAENAEQRSVIAGNDAGQRKAIADQFERDVIKGIFGSAYQTSRLRGLMLLRLAEMRANSGGFVNCGRGMCGLEAFDEGATVIRTSVDTPTVDSKWTQPFLSAIYDNRERIRNWEEKFYEALQIASRSEVASEAAEAVIRLKEDEGTQLGQSLKAIDLAEFTYRDADRKLEIMRSRISNGEGVPGETFNTQQALVSEYAANLDALKNEFSNSESGKRFAQLVSKSVDLASIQSSLEADEGYARIVLGKDKGFLIFITQDSGAGGVSITPINRSRADIEKAVEELRCAVDFDNLAKSFECAKKNVDNEKYQASFPEYNAKTAATLFDDIFAPVRSQLLGGGITHLIVQPDAALAPLPFSALVTTSPNAVTENSVTHIIQGRGSWVHDYNRVDWLSDAVSVSHSVGELSFVQARQSSRDENRVRAPKPFIGFAGFDSFDPDEAQRVAYGNEADPSVCSDVYQRISDIAEQTNKQAEVIRSEIGGEILTGSEFTDTAILSMTGDDLNEDDRRLEDYRIVLFATHGLSPGPVSKGCLVEPVLTTNLDTGTLKSDGFLTASDIASGMTLRADLVVLSACETAVGSAVSTFSDRPTAETFDGLVRAFYFAQAQSLLATHWTVSASQTTGVLENLFKREGLSDTAFAERLRETQVKVRKGSINGNSTSHPYFWASFVFVGDGRVKLDL